MAVIRRMLRDLDVPLEIARAADSCAIPTAWRMSSRNVRLSPCGPRSWRSRCRVRWRQEDAVRARDDARTSLDVEYVEVAPFDPPVLAAAVRVGGVRLIDNVLVEGASQMMPSPIAKLSLLRLGEMKRRGEPIAMVTAYDAPVRPGWRTPSGDGHLSLVGDSAAMVDARATTSTVPVTLDEMVMLTAAVAREARAARWSSATCRSGRISRATKQAVSSAVRMVKDGRRRPREARRVRAAAVASPRDRRRGHPRDGPHRPDAAVGDAPGRLSGAGTRRPPRRERSVTTSALGDSRRPAARALVVEAVPPAVVAARIARGAAALPVIGIGAGAACDGQVLVWHDLLGLCGDRAAPRFVQALRGPGSSDLPGTRRVHKRRTCRRVPRRETHLPDVRRRAAAVRSARRE